MCSISRISAAVALVAVLTGCMPAADDAPRPNAPVFFVRAEGLEAPLAGAQTRVFKPLSLEDISAADTRTWFEFVLVLIADEPETVELRLSDAATGGRAALQRLPSAIATATAPAPADLSATLAAGVGAFWFLGPDSDVSTYRFGVALPMSALSATTRLEMFASRASDGTPVGLDSIAIAPDFFYMAVIGDSVMWGNGLEERDKISHRVAALIEHDLGIRVITQRYAQSGATIVPGLGDGICMMSCNGEVPFVPTSITTQVSQVQRPDLIQFVLMDGCANDVTLTRILSPRTTDEELETLCATFCDEAMVELLRLVRATMPNAAIVVTGYYPFVSELSGALGLEAWELTREVIQSDGDASLLPELIHQSDLFNGASAAALENALAKARADAPELKIAFARPTFGPENAAFAPEPWLWGVTSENNLFEDLNLSLNLDLFPEDPLQTVRLRLCFDAATSLNLVECLYASLGHPNPLGAEAFALEIEKALRAIGVLPADR